MESDVQLKCLLLASCLGVLDEEECLKMHIRKLNKKYKFLEKGENIK
jgi:hypothetical protein